MKPFEFESPLSDLERLAFMKARLQKHQEILKTMIEEVELLEKKIRENSEH